VAPFKIWMARSSILSIAPAAEFTSRFLRTVILSRILVPEEFGTTVAISVMLGMAYLVTDVALDKFAMVGENSKSQTLPAVHVLSIARGILVALVLAVSAPATATLFGVPQFAGSFIIAASIPLVGSFSHLGIKQVQRNYVYLPDTLAIVFANLSALLILVPAVIIFRDHRAIIASFMTEALVYVVASHALAREPYSIRFDRVTLRGALKFGLPLLINGIGLAVMTQMDRTLVGHWFGVDILASYAVLLSTSVTPVGMILRVFGTAALSYLISSMDSDSIHVRGYHLLVFLFGLVAVSYMLFVATTMDILTPLIFGPKYTIDPTVHILVTILVFLRIQCGGAPTNRLLANGRTRELAAINLTRALGLVCAVIFMLYRPSFNLMLLGLLVGDLVTLVLLFGVSSAPVFSIRSESTIDLAASLVSALIISGTLNLAPGITWQARAVILAAGLLAIATQLLIGLRTNGPLRAFLGASLRGPQSSSSGPESP
jgi:O-antigen/teichoic acid export membrane protein